MIKKLCFNVLGLTGCQNGKCSVSDYYGPCHAGAGGGCYRPSVEQSWITKLCNKLTRVKNCGGPRPEYYPGGGCGPGIPIRRYGGTCGRHAA